MKKRNAASNAVYAFHWPKRKKWFALLIVATLSTQMNVWAFSELNSDLIVFESVQQQISGTVLDDGGVPLPGVNVLIEGTVKGTQTDFDGNYSINADSGDVLVFSYIGMKTQSITVANASTINVDMVVDASNLEEVVVIGYGTQKEALLTGSVGIIKSEEVKKVSYANSAGVLQGRVPGVKVEANGGAPGAGVNVVIRGTGSFGNDQPLYVVDGNIVESMSFLNPNDIESISVLKDASSAAIYGSRASNGVVLITTKKGSVGDVIINFETKIGYQAPTKYLDLLNAREYADWHNMARDNDGDARAIPNDTGFDPNIDTDWQDLSLNSAMYKEYNLNVSGGSENARFYVSGQVLDQEGVVVDSDFKRYNVTANTSFKKGIFSLSQSLLLSREQRNDNNFFNREGAVPPTIGVYDENNEGGFAGLDPNLHGLARGINWYGRAIIHDNLVTTDRLVGSVQPKLQLTKNFVYKMNLGIDYSLTHNYAFQPTFFQSTSQEASETIARLSENYLRSVSSLMENTVEYNNTFGKHGLTLLAGFTTQSIKARSAGGIGTNFIFNEFRVLDAADDNTDNTTGNLQENALTSYLGRLDYDYDGKYILSATIRRDGSSRFKEENRWGVFPSGSLGWRISKENFFPQDGFVSNLKLRGSYGLLGSQNVSGNNPNYITSSALNTSNFYNLGGTVYGGSIVTQLANPDLKWETTTIQNYGFDAEFLDGKVSFSAEYFKKRSEDILVNVPIPLSGGTGSSLPSNAATIDNSGFEFGGTYRHFSLDDEGVNFDVTLNFNTLKNEVIALGDGVNAITGGAYTQGGYQATRTDVGQPVGSFYGLITEGVYQTQEQITVDGRANAVLGDMNFVDLTPDGVIDDDDQTYLGSPIPDFEYSIAFNMDYKNFDLSLFIQGVEGNELWNGKRYHYVLDGTRGIKSTEALNAWTPTNTNTTVPRATIRDLALNKRPSDYLVEDGSYLRLKTFQLGYTLSTDFTEQFYITNLRFYVTGQNLLTFTDYKGYDPELGRPLDGDGGLFDGGVDRRAYPNNKNLLFGVQIGF
ncbi:TonB-dependent receptor [Aurantibacter crassamenti]|uniref:SusC/RagA family TonB-linked outer membrane protein n=1 Tax=Aurantibacter crassamenti TaxID=1837375 RepID=UPI00193A40FA|nr:TonB-dependent receptor [Aurantibacter crassamenti]MBM1105009.1 TonB-dependent receptor [Aurantibacter crassamenti]